MLSQPLDLGIPQKSLRARLKEEKKRKGHSVFHEQIERKTEGEQEKFLSSEKLEESNKDTSANPYNTLLAQVLR